MFNHFLYENPSVYDIMWKKYCRTRRATDDDIIQSMRIACWITKHSRTRRTTDDDIIQRMRIACWITKHCRTRRATDDDIIRRMCIACWITKPSIRLEYAILTSFPLLQSYANATECYVYMYMIGFDRE